LVQGGGGRCKHANVMYHARLYDGLAHVAS
jgi:hypothetical protein